MEFVYYTNYRRPSPLIGRGRGAQRGGIDRDQERELRALALLASDGDLAVVVLDDLAADREAQAHADRRADVGLDVARRVERLEGVLRGLGVHAVPRVGDRDADAAGRVAQV